MRHLLPLALLTACAEAGPKQDWQDWYDQGSALDVEEPIAFTDVPYSFTGETPLADLPRPGDFETWFAQGDAPPVGCTDWMTTDELPAVVEGIVTIHPRYYIKVNGCTPDDFAVDNEEKYYGSYFVQDASGGFFVLGDSKVAHFDMGDRVRIEVRAVKEYFDSAMISAHDVVEVTRGPEPIYYQVVDDHLLGAAEVAQVVRVRGKVAASASTFGEVFLCTGDDPDMEIAPDPGRNGDPVPRCAHKSVTSPPWFKVQVDAELNRRGIDWDPGTEIEATGPVILSFGDYPVVLMRVGQVTVLDPQ